jgi:4-amino-4-deoxy-L-arabinose transferase-like glycosyltransferase
MMAEIGDRRAMRHALTLAVAAFLLFLLRTPFTTLWDRDEPRFAQATVEMVASGRALVPIFNGELRAHKPILVYWLMSVPVRLLGATELSVRLVSCLSAALAGFLTFLAGRLLFTPRAGLWAMGCLLSTLLVSVEGPAATADALLLACLTAAAAAFAAGLARGARASHFAALALAIGAAELAKGPVGLAIPALGIALTLFLVRAEVPRAGRLARLGALAALGGTALFLAWAIPANVATEGRFLAEGFGRHVVGRALRPMEGHGGRFLLMLPYYVPVALLGFMPWTLHLPGALSAVLHGRAGGNRGRAFVIGWTLPTFVLFTLVATKLPHYVLPAWPALALAVGATLDSARRGDLPARDLLWLRRGAFLFVPLALLQAAALVTVPFLLKDVPLHIPCFTIAAAGLALGAWALRLHLSERFEAAARVLLAGALVIQTAVAVWLLPALEPLKPVPPLAAAIRARTAAGAPVATYGFEEPSLDFYLDRPPIERLGNDEAVAAWTKREGPGALVLPRDAFARLGPDAAARCAEIGSARGFNVANGTRSDLVAVERRPPR